jgi:hypothetical protein
MSVEFPTPNDKRRYGKIMEGAYFPKRLHNPNTGKPTWYVPPRFVIMCIVLAAMVIFLVLAHIAMPRN